MKNIFCILTSIFLVTILTGCNQSQEETFRHLDKIRIGLIPDQSEDKTFLQYKGIFEKFTLRTKIPYEYVKAESYSDLLNKFNNEEVDFAYFGAVTYIKAHRKKNAVPVVMRNIDLEFTSAFIISAGSDAKSIGDLKGKTLAFGSKLSTSGHIAPRYFMMQDGIIPENFFGEVIYTGSHENTAHAVGNSNADIGVLNSLLVDEFIQTERVSNIKVLKITPSYPDYVWATQPYVSDDLRTVLQRSFTGLMPHNPADRDLIEKTGADFFIPADHDMFSELEKTMDLVEKNRI